MKKIGFIFVHLIILEIALLIFNNMYITFFLNTLVFLLLFILIKKLTVLSTKDIKDLSPDKFHKILISTIDDKTILNDINWTWYIEVLDRHKYHVSGYHPVCKRIDVIKDNVII